jgi:hypothetical protein
MANLSPEEILAGLLTPSIFPGEYLCVFFPDPNAPVLGFSQSKGLKS